MRRLGLLLTYGTKEDGGNYDFSSLIEKYDKDVAVGLARHQSRFTVEMPWNIPSQKVFYTASFGCRIP
jgi:hypothetical protein